jgi:hypothetical protein
MNRNILSHPGAKELTRGAVEVGWPEDALEGLQHEGVQHRLALGPWENLAPQKRRPRVAVVEGFRLHADTHVHANDRVGKWFGHEAARRGGVQEGDALDDQSRVRWRGGRSQRGTGAPQAEHRAKRSTGWSSPSLARHPRVPPAAQGVGSANRGSYTCPSCGPPGSA